MSGSNDFLFWITNIIIKYRLDKSMHKFHKSQNSFLWSNKKIILDLGSKKGDENDDYSSKLIYL